VECWGLAMGGDLGASGNGELGRRAGLRSGSHAASRSGRRAGCRRCGGGGELWGAMGLGEWGRLWIGFGTRSGFCCVMGQQKKKSAGHSPRWRQHQAQARDLAFLGAIVNSAKQKICATCFLAATTIFMRVHVKK